MYQVFSCLTVEHDWRLVVLAGIVCFLASLVAVNLFHRARATQGSISALWLVTAGAATGIGIWSTHFIAMLAYEPGIAVAYGIGLTALSLVAAIVVTCAGLTAAVHGPAPWAAPFGGAVVGGGVACMHYTGMAALELPGHVTWSFELVLASIAFGILFGIGALAVAVRRDDFRAILPAAVLLTLAIVSHHFTAMGAAVVVPDPTQAISGFSLSSDSLAAAIAGATVSLLAVCLVGAYADRRSEAKLQQQAAHLGHHDTLTDLPNRTSFNHQLAATFERATAISGSFAVVCLDIDRFKDVNDVFGQKVGDMLLREVAGRLRLAADGAFLARLGSDEFALIAADGAQPVTAEALVERLLAAVRDEFEAGGQRTRVAFSIGVAIFPADGADAETLLNNANAALYRAKAEGRASIRFFEAAMDMRLRERRALQQDLQFALEQGQFALHFQPQAHIDGEIAGFEALVRWQHPVRGLLLPDTFIPVAEESGLIDAIGAWILREACREAASWPKPLQIAVNLSPGQFRQGDLPELAHSVLLETGLAAGRLELEITESMLIADFSRASSILRRLKSLGVRIAMDDFGTGYSSLSYLQSFPFDKIKIDRTFVSNLGRGPQSLAIVRAVVGLCRGLGLPVVAEGVETADQLAVLAKEGCDQVQGFIVGRPAPMEDYAKSVGRAPVRVLKLAAAS